MTKTAGAPHQVRLHYDGTFLGICSDNSATLAWLVEFLEPSFTVAVGGISDFLITLQIKEDDYARLVYQAAAEICTERDCFSNDGYFAHFPSWQDAEGVTWIHSSTDQVFIAIPSNGIVVQVIASGNTYRNRLALMRVVRELVTMRQLQRGQLLLHAAAFESSGEAILICGPKNAGKTTLLIHALQSGCGFIANDRIFVEPYNAQSVVRGMPTIVRVRQSSLQFFSRLAERWASSFFQRGQTIAECRTVSAKARPWIASGGSLPGLSGVQLCNLFDARLIQAANLAKIVFPSINSFAKGSELIQLGVDEAAQRLTESVLAPCRPWRWPSAVRRLAVSAPPSWDSIEDQCQRLARTVPCYQCVLGPDAYQLDGSGVLSPYLAAA